MIIDKHIIRGYVQHLILPKIGETQSVVSSKIFEGFSRITRSAIINTLSEQQLASQLGHFTRDWAVDWYWVAYHIMSDHGSRRYAYALMQSGSQEDVLVYKWVREPVSIDCLDLYLTDSNDYKSEPRTFKLSQLIANGSNLGRDSRQCRPVVGATDFGMLPTGEGWWYDQSILSVRPNDSLWNSEAHEFIIELNERERQIADMIKIFEVPD
jgi:hypothetical protein